MKVVLVCWKMEKIQKSKGKKLTLTSASGLIEQGVAKALSELPIRKLIFFHFYCIFSFTVYLPHILFHLHPPLPPAIPALLSMKINLFEKYFLS